MEKLLITTLGAGSKGRDGEGDYETTNYILEGKKYSSTLSSLPIINHYKINKVFFIGTSGSMWDNLYLRVGGENEEYLGLLIEKKADKNLREEDLEELERTIDNHLNSQGSKCILIDYAKNDEDEIWDNFEKIIKIQEYLSGDEEIYLDITHGFRYMPILNIFALEFLSQLNEKLKPKKIFYAMLDKKYSPIVDFSIFFELLEWAKAVEEMENFASLNRLVTLARGKIKEEELKGLKEMEEAFKIANMSAIHKALKNLNAKLDHLKENDNKVIKLLIPNIEKFIKELYTPTLSEFQFKLARFFEDKHNFALAYIAFAEAIVTYICEKRELGECTKKEIRDEVKKIIREGNEYPFDSKRRKLARLYKKISFIRNGIAHQITTNNPKLNIENFPKYYKEVRKLLKETF
ncbi:MAG: TIGR02221 family CRISPR-associated protein [Epsilonproteobacteria bacterium]|nr:TIGR02221 family CRISPR-associated protein [Campylobacterota bacterium]